jgi:hypothetical protein
MDLRNTLANRNTCILQIDFHGRSRRLESLRINESVKMAYEHDPALLVHIDQ